jgi:uncharacterized integral membrane protein (TIGR00697 family)
MPVSDLLAGEWIDKFSGSDVAILATVNANDAGIKKIIEHKARFPYGIIYLTIFFSVMLITMNLIGDSISTFKLSLFGGYEFLFPTALIVFPITYCFGAIITETYGFVVSRHVIWGAFIVNSICIAIILTLQRVGLLNGSILGVSHQIARALSASAAGYFAGELSNALMVSRLKIALKGRALILRFMAANVVGAVVDSLLFGGLLFYGVVSVDVLRRIIVTQIVIKIVYETLFSLMFYKIVDFVKKWDGVDYFDYRVDFLGREIEDK